MKKIKHGKKSNFIKKAIIIGVLLLIIAVISGVCTGEYYKKVKANEIPSAVLYSSNETIHSLVLEKNNKNVRYILKHIDMYPMSLLKLAVLNPETIDFVKDYPKEAYKYNSEDIGKMDVTKGKIPLFIQWDKRWGYRKYGDEFLAINGCGPTSLSMVIAGLTGDSNINPYVIAKFSQEHNLYVKGKGSKWNLMIDGAKAFGLQGKELPLSKDVIFNTLKSGQPIIMIMGKGAFTKTGHFIVLTGVKDGKIEVNDPFSLINSKKLWNINVFMEQAQNLWTFKLAPKK